MNKYKISREGWNLKIESGSKSKTVSAIFGRAEEIPEFAKKMIRESGVNPADYFWFNGTPIRVTHKNQVLEIAEAATSEYKLSPEGLRVERENLVAKIQGSYDQARYIRNKAWESGNESTGAMKNSWDEKARVAMEELKKFDLEHPEILEKIEAEKRQAAESFSRTN